MYMYFICTFFVFRAIAGLFNVAHDTSRGSQDPNFPRLGQMLTEYDHALRKISEDFTPLSKVSVLTIKILTQLSFHNIRDTYCVLCVCVCVCVCACVGDCSGSDVTPAPIPTT